jgi:hypothetical protein
LVLGLGFALSSTALVVHDNPPNCCTAPARQGECRAGR